MNSTIYEATKTGPVVVMMGHNRTHTPGDVCYRFRRPLPFPSGMAQTLPSFARGLPVTWQNGCFRDSTDNSIVREWSTAVTVIESY